MSKQQKKEAGDDGHPGCFIAILAAITLLFASLFLLKYIMSGFNVLTGF